MAVEGRVQPMLRNETLGNSVALACLVLLVLLVLLLMW
jgi:hypothetical protein